MKLTSSLTALSLLALLNGCQTFSAPAPKAVAELQPTRNYSAAGQVEFFQQGNEVIVQGRFTGLKPGAHGFHIHDKGDCSAPDGTSAGGHFNPTKQTHGHPDHAAHHLGDMPVLEANAQGEASFRSKLSGVTLDSGEVGIIGRSLIIHADADDFTSQPAGNSGARIACGVIKAR